MSGRGLDDDFATGCSTSRQRSYSRPWRLTCGDIEALKLRQLCDQPMIATASVALVVALSIMPLVLRHLRRRSMWDVPNARSSHQLVTPRGGGLGLIVAFLVGVVATGAGTSDVGPMLWSLIAAWVAAGAVGLRDDLKSSSTRSRLAAQMLIGVVVVIATATGSHAHVALVIFLPLALAAVVSYINAFNFMDGVNGMSGFHAVLGGGFYTWLAVDFNMTGVALIASAVCGAGLGFLPWNFPRARTFLGDVGSYFLGAALGSLAIVMWMAGAAAVLVCAPLVIYLTDTGSTLLLRARAGMTLLQPHRDHAYQQLSVAAGHVGATLTTSVASSTCVAIAVACRPRGSASSAVGMITVAAVYIVGARLVGRRATRSRALLLRAAGKQAPT